MIKSKPVRESRIGASVKTKTQRYGFVIDEIYKKSGGGWQYKVGFKDGKVLWCQEASLEFLPE